METDTEATAASLAEKVTVLDDMHMASTAWNEVKPVTIRKYFKKAFSYSSEEHEAFNPLADVLVPSNMGGVGGRCGAGHHQRKGGRGGI